MPPAWTNVCARVCACVHVCARACVRAGGRKEKGDLGHCSRARRIHQHCRLRWIHAWGLALNQCTLALRLSTLFSLLLLLHK
jgi:hypothetical protein